MDKFPYSSAPLRRVKGVQFGILDPEFLVQFCALRCLLDSSCRPCSCCTVHPTPSRTSLTRITHLQENQTHTPCSCLQC